MPAINFQKRFAWLVASGHKKQTIRKKHKSRPIRQGDKLYLYTGMRTRCCEKIGESICTQVKNITIGGCYIEIDGKPLPLGKAWDIAQDDGFTSPGEMINFFHDLYGFPFDGVLIEWQSIA